MHHYVIESRFGLFPAYGREALKIRVREMAALTQIAKTTAGDIFMARSEDYRRNLFPALWFLISVIDRERRADQVY